MLRNPSPVKHLLVTLGTALLLSLMASSLVQAQAIKGADIPGSGDHPAVERVAGSFIRHFERQDFARVTLPAGPRDSSSRDYSEVVTLEGEHLWIVYDFADPDTSPLRVHRSYLSTLQAAGFEIVFAGVGDALVNAGRNANFFTGQRHLGGNGPLNNREDVYYLLAKKPDQGLHVSVSTFQFAGNNPRGTGVSVNVVTEEVMQVSMDHQPLSASEMADSLLENGRVAIQDILFAFDSDQILPESADSLNTIASLLQEQPELGLLVVGHTDDMGQFDYNLTLSMQRASAVVRYLQQQHGIAADRLQAAGAGMLAPIASNRTEAGRSQNRRVELVEVRNR